VVQGCVAAFIVTLLMVAIILKVERMAREKSEE
jgi:hypothetical protein